MPLAAGTRLGPYEILKPIGAGGMGEVYKARDTRLDRTVAVKVSNERFSERFEREARAIAALNHPNICALYDVGPNYLVMEFIDGAPLQGPVAADKALPMALQIADALDAAHRKGVVHRDLKPANILVTASGVKLLDFGLAKIENAASAGDALTLTATQPGTLLGTAAYMAPEQAEGQPVDARSDIFAFGLVLYEMLSGRRAFDGETLLSTVAAILHREPRPLDAPPHFVRIVTRCLKKDPVERFQTAADVKAALLQQAAGGESAEPVPSIAVLPFANLSADKENEYFSDGLAEEIINALTQVPGMKVTARTSAFSFRGKDVKIAEIARELGVAHVLEGSVRKAGNRIRVTAQLVNAADGFHLWSQRYDRELTDVFAIQDEMAAAIVCQLRVNLTGSAPCAKHPSNLEAYEAVLEGRHHWYRLTPASSVRARECFERAVSIESGYGPAHVGLAGYYVGLAVMGIMDPRQALPKARAAAQRAVEIDPSDGEAASMLASVCALDYNWEECGRHARRAVELSPASSSARFPLAFWWLRPRGRLEEALAEAERILEIDPLWHTGRYTKAVILFGLRRYDAAAEAYRRTLDIEPTYSLGLMGLSQSEARRGNFDEALAVAGQAIQLHGRYPVLLGPLGIVHALAGQREEAHHVVEEMRELVERSSVAAGGLMAIHAELGETEAAFAWAEKAIDLRDPVMLGIKTMPHCDPMRGDPRYPALLRRMNLA